jgi:hypothetical protein
MALSINPIKQTNALGTFNVETTGYIAGTSQDDPVARFRLAGGVLAATETKPMFGGVAISENIPGVNGNPRPELGPTIIRATQVAGAAPAAGDLTGFCVFDQDHSMIMTAESAVPQAAAGMSVHFYRLGSGARIALPISPVFGGALPGNILTMPVAWDFTNQQICPLESGSSTAAISAGVWNQNTFAITLTVGTDLTAELAAGDPIAISGVINNPANPNGFNGTFVILSITSTTIIVQGTATNPGTYSSGGAAAVVATAKVALPVKFLDVNIGGSMVPVYDPATGFVNWNRAGSAAIVLI